MKGKKTGLSGAADGVADLKTGGGKMRRSVLLKTIGITGFVFFVANLVLIIILGRALYRRTRDVYVSYAVNASSVGAQFIDAGVYEQKTEDSGPMVQFEPSRQFYPEFREAYASLLKEICDDGRLQYLYVLQPDTANETVTYLALASSKEKDSGVIEDVTVGTVRHRELSEGEKAAYQGKKDCIEEVDNQYGHVISCYNPILNSNTGKVEAIIGADISLDYVEKTYWSLLTNCILLMTGILIGGMILLFAIMKNRVLKPAKVISEKMMAFTANHDAADSRVPVKGEDEFARMAGAFNTMTEEISQYIEDIEVLNREKHRRETEMSIAAGIQSGLLPAKETSFHGVRFRASMSPAKEVGGDFYDYAELPDGKYFLCVADVSGKGVSAALFMARAITVLRQFAQMGYSPRQMLESSNKIVCAYNVNMMFVTVFVAVYDPKTGVLTYSNAGHNHPYLVSGSLQSLEGAAGMAIGIYEEAEYEDAELRLAPGDSLFLYTDGVNEAENGSKEFFGNERMEAVLSALEPHRREYVMEAMTEALSAFTGDEPQSDDVTMLSMTLCTRHEEELMPEKKNLKKLNELILTDPYIPKALRKKLCLVAEEIFVNICSHGEEGEKTPVSFLMEVSSKVVMTFRDGGSPSDPLREGEDHDSGASAAGPGIFLTKAIAESCHYEYTDGQNILTVIISCASDPQG